MRGGTDQSVSPTLVQVAADVCKRKLVGALLPFVET